MKYALFLSILIMSMSAISDPVKTSQQAIAKYYFDEVKQAPERPMDYDAKTRSSLVDARMKELEASLDNKSIDLVEHAARAYSLSKIYFPDDALFNDLRKTKLDLSVDHENGRITKEELDVLWDMKKREYSAARDNKRKKEEQIARDNEATSRSASTGNFLNAIGRGLNNASRQMQQQVPVTCQTIANVTTCR